MFDSRNREVIPVDLAPEFRLHQSKRRFFSFEFNRDQECLVNLITSLFLFLRCRSEVLVRSNGSILPGGLAPWICLTLRSDLCRILGEIHASLKNRFG